MTGCIISNNSAIGATDSGGVAYGGGITSFANIVVNASVISGNLAEVGANTAVGGGFGGGFYNGGGVTTIDDSVLSANVCQGGVNGPYNVGEGGAIEVNGAGDSDIITGVAFSGNQAIGGNGGTGQYVGEGAGAPSPVTAPFPSRPARSTTMSP